MVRGRGNSRLMRKKLRKTASVIKPGKIGAGKSVKRNAGGLLAIWIIALLGGMFVGCEGRKAESENIEAPASIPAIIFKKELEPADGDAELEKAVAKAGCTETGEMIQSLISADVIIAKPGYRVFVIDVWEFSALTAPGKRGLGKLFLKYADCNNLSATSSVDIFDKTTLEKFASYSKADGLKIY